MPAWARSLIASAVAASAWVTLGARPQTPASAELDAVITAALARPGRGAAATGADAPATPASLLNRLRAIDASGLSLHRPPVP